jgi:hypothetical protein
MRIRRTRAGIALIALAALVRCAPRALTDADLLAYVATSYDKAQMVGSHVVLGVHAGMRVVVDFPCSDLCPAYTTRIVHYDLPAGPECAAHGGTEILIGTPVGVGQMPLPYCVPKVLADRVERFPA